MNKMRTIIEGCMLRIDSHECPTPKKPMVGNLTVSLSKAEASFEEEEGAKVIYGEPKSKQVFRGKKCSVWYNPEKDRYVVRVQIEALTNKDIMMGECDAEECFNFLKRKHYEQK